MQKQTSERILSIRKIQDVGNWSYSLEKTKGPREFERINLIYGPNGSGKTSLANLFFGLAHDWPNEGERTWQRASFSVGRGEGDSRETDCSEDSIFSRVYVFTKDMVARAHALSVDDASMSTILTLGKENVDREQRIAQLIEELDMRRGEKKEVEARVEKCKGDVDGTVRGFQDAVFAALAFHKGWRTKGSFNASMAESTLERFIKGQASLGGESDNFESEVNETRSPDVVGEEAFQNAREILSEGQRDRLDIPVFVQKSIIEEIGQINQDICCIPNVVDVDTLVTNPDASNWVQQGIEHHKHSSRCIFCGSRLTSERLEELRAHFSNEVEDLQGRLRGYRARLQSEIANVEKLRDRLKLLEKELNNQSTVIQYISSYDEELENYLTWILSAVRAIDKKLDNVMRKSDDMIVKHSIPDSQKLSEWLSEYNESVAEQDALKQSAENDVIRYYCANYCESYLAAQRALKDVNGDLVSYCRQIESINEELEQLANIEGDPLPSAQSLNVQVADLLGRNELKFEVQGKKYRVTRNGNPAIRLSEGEQTAITFVHFLQLIKVELDKGYSPIVVIDDPVSSLDERIQNGVASLIRDLVTGPCFCSKGGASHAPSEVAQLFVLTHSFEFYRYLYCSLPRDQKCGPMRAYEILSVCDSDIRRPVLAEWCVDGVNAKKRMEVFSSYHHAFGLLGRAVLEQKKVGIDVTIDLQLLYPNLARRLLEQFLAFKYPDYALNFSEGVANAAGEVRSRYSSDLDAAQAISTCEGIILPATNAGSHNRMPTTVGIQSGESVKNLIKQVFYFIYLVDESHFEGMCRALEFSDSSRLLPDGVRQRHSNP
jgi:hypothetical protein